MNDTKSTIRKSADESGPEAGPETGGDAETADQTAAQEVSLSARVAELEGDKTGLLAKLARAHADLANFKRRSQQEISEIERFGNQLFAGDLLRAVDSLDRALASVPAGLSGFTWIDGLAIVRAQFDAVLRAHGVESLKAIGEIFDPMLHEAMVGLDDPQPEADLVVLQEFQRGYKMHDRVLRPALVKVGPRPAKEAAAAPSVGESVPQQGFTSVESPQEGSADSGHA